MDLETFVRETLQQIIASVGAAQLAEGGEAINAKMFAAPGGNLVNSGSKGMFTRVDFDVAISAETSVGGKGKLQVFGFGGAEAGGERKSHHANRISFSVPIRLPDGGNPDSDPHVLVVPKHDWT